MIVLGHWFGVFNRKGDLEAVEETFDGAQSAADNLDARLGKPLQRTRAIRSILVCGTEENDIYKTEKHHASISERDLSSGHREGDDPS